MKKKIAIGACILAVLLAAGSLWYTRPRTFWEAAGLDPEAVTGVAGTVIEYGFQNGRPYSQSRQMENRSPGQAEFDALMSQLDEMQFRGTLRNLLPLPSAYSADKSGLSTILILAAGEDGAIVDNGSRGSLRVSPRQGREAEFYPADPAAWEQLADWLAAHADQSPETVLS